MTSGQIFRAQRNDFARTCDRSRLHVDKLRLVLLNEHLPVTFETAAAAEPVFARQFRQFVRITMIFRLPLQSLVIL